MATCDQQLTSAGITSSYSPSSSRNKICCPSFKFAATMSILLWSFTLKVGITYGSAAIAFNSFANRDFGVVVNTSIGGYGLIGLILILCCTRLEV